MGFGVSQAAMQHGSNHPIERDVSWRVASTSPWRALAPLPLALVVDEPWGRLLAAGRSNTFKEKVPSMGSSGSPWGLRRSWCSFVLVRSKLNKAVQARPTW
eukprot:12774432-Prorocentrum_lima.AAC.1